MYLFCLLLCFVAAVDSFNFTEIEIVEVVQQPEPVSKCDAVSATKTPLKDEDVEKSLLNIFEYKVDKEVEDDPPKNFFQNFFSFFKNKERNNEEVTANVNNYVDFIVANLARVMVLLELDPFKLDDVHTGFKRQLLFLTYQGEIDLTNGTLSDISTIHRKGDATVSYKRSSRKLYLEVPLAFEDLQVTYQYSANFMGLGPVGGIEGYVRDIEMLLTMIFDFETYQAKVDTLKVTNSGFIHIEFTGHLLTDWIVNILTDAVSLLLHDLILDVVSFIMHSALNDMVTDVNKFFNIFINPKLFPVDKGIALILPYI